MTTEPKRIGHAAVDALNTYAASFSRDLTSVLFLHAPGRFKADAVRNACRVMAVGVLAHKLRGLIAAAPPGDGKGQRGRLETLAADILAGRLEDPLPVASPGAVRAPEGQAK